MLSGIADFVAWILDKTGDAPEMEWFDKIVTFSIRTVFNYNFMELNKCTIFLI